MCRSGLIASAVITICLAAAAAAEEVQRLQIQVTARPLEDASALSLSVGFTERTLARPIADGTYEITLTLPREGEQFVTPKLAAEWDDDITRLVALSVNSYFIGSPVKVHFYGSNGSVTRFPCHESVPGNVATAFKMLFLCRDIVLERERATHRWTLAHRQALDGWHRANRFLTDRLVDSRGRSPYGLDPELVHRLAEVRRLVEEEGYERRRFEPLRYADLEVTLRMYDEALIELAGWTAELVAQQRFEDARSVNAAATDALERYLASGSSPAARTQTVRGTNLQILHAETRYLRSLQLQR